MYTLFSSRFAAFCDKTNVLWRSNVSFFSESEWIPRPADWPVRNLRPTRYDLETGEGARVWQECLHRSASYHVWEMPDDSASGVASRYGLPVMIRPRLGQGAFRVSVTEAYNRACAPNWEHSLPALDAAHIKPFAKDGPHEVRNGLLLRADLHRLFEQGYVTVTHDHVLEVSNRLRDDYHNGRSYYPLHGTRIALPAIETDRPSRELLAWHNQHVS